MSSWANKRFWKLTEAVAEADGFTVKLDGRGVKTPGKSPLIVPSERMATEIAREFDTQEDVIDPTTMPWTRSANSAIEKVATQRSEVEAHLIGYAATDLLSYRATGPEGLIVRQAEGWDPILNWVAETFGARLNVTSGVMPTDQPPEALARLAQTMPPMSDFQMTGFHDLVTLTGSFSLGLGIAEQKLSPEEAWLLSRIDEMWQIEQWGDDEEAAEHAEIKHAALAHAADFFHNA